MKRRRDPSNGSKAGKHNRGEAKKGKYKSLLNNSEKEKTSTTFGLTYSKVIGGAGILAIIIFPFIAKYNVIKTEETEVFKPRLLSAIVFEYINYNVQIINCMNLIKAILQEDPLENIIKARLRPIQERVASLRTQTRIYEQMQRIRGGPTQFMSSTLKELEEIYYDKIRALDAEVVATAMARSVRLNLIPETINEVTKSGARRLEDIASGPFRFLLTEGVKLVPDNIDLTSLSELKYLEEHIGNITLEQINEKLMSLAVLYKKREDLIGQIMEKYALEIDLSGKLRRGEEVDPELFISDMFLSIDNDDFKVKFKSYVPLAYEVADLQEKIIDEIELNGKYYELTVPMGAKLMKDMDTLEEQFHLKAAAAKNMDAYLVLKHDVVGDIEKLITRVKNLQYNH